MKLSYNEIQAEHTPAFKFYIEAERFGDFCIKWWMIIYVCLLASACSIEIGIQPIIFCHWKYSIGGLFVQVFVQIYGGTIHAAMITVISYFNRFLLIHRCLLSWIWEAIQWWKKGSSTESPCTAYRNNGIFDNSMNFYRNNCGYVNRCRTSNILSDWHRLCSKWKECVNYEC